MRSLFSGVLFKEQLRRFWTISVLFFIVLIFIIVIPIYFNNLSGIGYFMTLISMRNPMITVIEVLVPMITATALFSYGFQNKSITDMYAYPFKRGQILVSNALAGLTLYSLPILVICLVLLFPITSPDISMLMSQAGYYRTLYFDAPIELYSRMFTAGDIINTPLIVAGFFTRIFICFTFYYTLFVLASTLAGNVVSFLVLCLGLPFVPIGFVGLSQLVARDYCYGYSININRHWIMQFLVNFNPVLFYRNFHMYIANAPGLPFPTDSGITSSLWLLNILPPLLCYIIISAAFLAVSVYCARKRKAEHAGDSVVFKPIKNILVFLMALLGMILAGYVGLLFRNNLDMHGSFVIYGSFALGFVLFYFIAQMIAEMSFNVISKAAELWKYGAVITATFMLVLLITKADIFGISKYIPDPSDVEGVYIGNVNNNSLTPLSDSSLADNTLCTDKDTIAAMISVHKEIIESQDYLRGEYIRMTESEVPITIQRGEVDPLYTYKYFIYRLKNGKTVVREYFLSPDFIKASGLLELMNRNEVILSAYPSLKTSDNVNLLEIWVDSWTDKSGLKIDSDNRLKITQPDQIKSISKEIQEDIIINEQYMGRKYSYVGVNGESAVAVDSDKNYIVINIYMKRNRLSKYGVSPRGDLISLAKYDNTLAWLRDNGYYSEE